MVEATSSTYDYRNVRAISISQKAFSRLAIAAVVSYALLVVTGGAVRLSGSGLGCPDWPSCYDHRLTAAVSFHPLIEFGNRLITVAVSVISIAVFLAAMALLPKRRDIRWLSSGLLLGLVAQIVLGGLVVLFKLNPYLVALHFFLTLVVLGDAIVLYCVTIRPSTGDGQNVRANAGISSYISLQFGVLIVAILAGTVVTGSGPHAGDQNARRIAIAFRDAAELHSTIALFLVGLTLGGLFALRLGKAPIGIQRQARLVLEVYAVQGLLGYLQYSLHDNALVVEIHMVGATSAFASTLVLLLGCHGIGPAASRVSVASRASGALTNQREPLSA
jgi:heme a synthase